MTNLQKAIKVVTAFKTGECDFKGILSDDCVAHGPGIGKGRAEIEAYFLNQHKASAKNGPKARVVRSFVDGDYVVLHVVYVSVFPEGDMVAFNVFRFDRDLIVEQWFAMQKRAPRNKSGRSMFDGPETVTDLDQTAANKKIVGDFFDKVLIAKTDQASVTKYLHKDYMQHNPNAVDTLAGTMAAFQEAAKKGKGLSFGKIDLLLGQGNFVLVASQATAGQSPVHVFDLYRLEQGVIVEHWDVIQPVASAK